MTDQIRYLGHSTFHLTLQGKHILIDPFLTDNPQCPPDVTPATIPCRLHPHHARAQRSHWRHPRNRPTHPPHHRSRPRNC